MKLRLNEDFFDINEFHIGDHVRVLLANKNEYIGTIVEITEDYIKLHFKYNYDRVLETKDIAKIKKVDSSETMDDVCFFDDEEEDFWKKHIISHDGIVDRHSLGMPYLDKFGEGLDDDKKKKHAMGWFTSFFKDPETSMRILNHNLGADKYKQSQDGGETNSSADATNSDGGAPSGNGTSSGGGE